MNEFEENENEVIQNVELNKENETIVNSDDKSNIELANSENNETSQNDSKLVNESSTIEEGSISGDISESGDESLSGDESVSEETELTEEEKKILQAKLEAKWYVLHTFSGYENVAKENLEIVIDKYNLQTRIFDIVIPMEDVMEEKNGKRKIVTRKLMPGYILVKMIYGDDIWHAITRTRGITGFVGPKGRPLHLNEEEIRKMHLEKQVVIDVNIAVGDKVEVLDGALNGFIGDVKSVDVAGKKCRVVVEMFGRETPVDLPLNQIRRIN